MFSLLVCRICNQPALFTVCACIMMPICKDQTLHSGSMLRIDLSKLIGVVNQQWDWEKAKLKLLPLTLHLVNPCHTGSTGECCNKLQTKVCHQWSKHQIAERNAGHQGEGWIRRSQIKAGGGHLSRNRYRSTLCHKFSICCFVHASTAKEETRTLWTTKKWLLHFSPSLGNIKQTLERFNKFIHEYREKVKVLRKHFELRRLMMNVTLNLPTCSIQCNSATAQHKHALDLVMCPKHLVWTI